MDKVITSVVPPDRRTDLHRGRTDFRSAGTPHPHDAASNPVCHPPARSPLGGMTRIGAPDVLGDRTSKSLSLVS